MGSAGKKAGAGGSAGTGATSTANVDYVYKPSNSDDVSEKLNKADTLKFSASTVTMKDENGKTIGMVTKLKRANTLSGASLFQFNQDFKKASGGVMLTQLNDYGLAMDAVYKNDNQIYVFNKINTDEHLSKYSNNPQIMEYNKSTIEKSKKKAEFLKKLEGNGIIVINYHS